MVVCKCRKATKLYCFVHRQPVCLDCVAAPEHLHCVVKLYSNWVNDGDYDWPPKCPVCDQSMESSPKPTVRLGCLHVLHSECLSHHLQSFPPHTAPAGFGCPSCSSPIWPAPNPKDASSALYLNLRSVMSQFDTGKSLLFPSSPSVSSPDTSSSTSNNPSSSSSSSTAAASAAVPPVSTSTIGSLSSAQKSSHSGGPTLSTSLANGDAPVSKTASSSPPPPSTAAPMGSSAPSAAVSRKGLSFSSKGAPTPGHGASDAVSIPVHSDPADRTEDADDDERKYTRRGPLHWQFLRYLGALGAPVVSLFGVLTPSSRIPEPSLPEHDAGADGRGGWKRRRPVVMVIDPRKLLLLIAIVSCMVTMLMLYYRLAQSALSVPKEAEGQTQ